MHPKTLCVSQENTPVVSEFSHGYDDVGDASVLWTPPRVTCKLENVDSMNSIPRSARTQPSITNSTTLRSEAAKAVSLNAVKANISAEYSASSVETEASTVSSTTCPNS